MKRKEYNESYFENIDTEDKAYFLGFIFADGCIINDIKNYRYKLVIKIHNKDAHILESFIESIDGKMCTWKSNNQEIVEISLSGKKIIEDLEKLGLHQNKTFTIKYPIINKDLERHFLRGYFDGDGCIRISKDKRDGEERGDMRIVSGSIDMLNSINKRMNELFQTNLNKLYGPKDKNYKFVGWASMKDIEKIYDGFYKESCFFLHRKKQIFDKAIVTIRDKQKYRKK